MRKLALILALASAVLAQTPRGVGGGGSGASLPGVSSNGSNGLSVAGGIAAGTTTIDPALGVLTPGITIGSPSVPFSMPFAALGCPATARDGWPYEWCAEVVNGSPALSIVSSAGVKTPMKGADGTNGSPGASGATGPAGADPSDPAFFYIAEDFPTVRPDASPNGQLAWNFATINSGTVTNVDQQAGTSGHPGIRALTTGATSGNYSRLNWQYNAVNSIYGIGSNSEFSTWSVRNIVLLDNAAGVAQAANMSYCFGLGATGRCVHTGPVIGVSIAFDSVDPALSGCTWSTTHWMYISKSAAGYSCRDSGVTASSGTWYKLQIDSSTPGTVNFSINGSASWSMSGSAIDSSSTNHYGPAMEVLTRTTAAKAVWLDFFSIKGTLSR